MAFVSRQDDPSESGRSAFPATPNEPAAIDKQERFMKGSLLESNPWLRDPRRRAELLRMSAASSSAVEGIFKPFRDMTAGTVTPPARKCAKSAPSAG